jgi:predicted permease
MTRFLTHLRWALRSLQRTPGFTAMAVLILALGIGANAAMFNLVDRALLRPLPYPNPDCLVVVWGSALARGGGATPVSPADFLDWQREATRFDGLAALASTAVNLTGGLEPVRAQGMRVSRSFFQVAGVHPALGRGFTRDEDDPGGPRAVVLSHAFWTRQFGGDATLVGKTIALDGVDTLVVGVMPRGFRFEFPTDRLDLLVPLAFSDEEAASRGFRFLSVAGRLKASTSREAAQTELQAIAQRLSEAYPASNAHRSVQIAALAGEIAGPNRNTLWLLQGAVLFLLLVACANLANLMVARSAAKRGELAIRAALGASPWDLFLQRLTESALLGLLGGCLGLALARGVQAGLVRILALPAWVAAQGLAPRQACFTLALSLLVALALGFTPALRPEGVMPWAFLQDVRSGTPVHHRLRGLLVALEVALTTALLIGAGLMLRTVHHLQTVDPGFQADPVLMATLTLPDTKYPGPAARIAFLQRLQERVAAMAGVTSAATSDTPPLGGSNWTTSCTVEGQDGQKWRLVSAHHVTPTYFRTLGIRLLQGRDLAPGAADEVVVSQAFARSQFPEGAALGQRLSLDGSQGHPWQRVVGVAADVRQKGLAAASGPELYFPVTYLYANRRASASFSLLLRCAPPPMAMAPALKAALREMDPDLPLGGLRPMAALLEQDHQEARGRGALLAAFAALALFLAGVGLYAVVNGLTALRLREIGLRMALGAQVRDILILVLGQGLRMALGGIVAGLLGAVALGRFLQASLQGVRFWDPATLVAVLLLLLLVLLAACYLPALRAARVEPGTALRDD